MTNHDYGMHLLDSASGSTVMNLCSSGAKSDTAPIHQQSTITWGVEGCPNPCFPAIILQPTTQSERVHSDQGQMAFCKSKVRGRFAHHWAPRELQEDSAHHYGRQAAGRSYNMDKVDEPAKHLTADVRLDRRTAATLTRKMSVHSADKVILLVLLIGLCRTAQSTQ